MDYLLPPRLAEYKRAHPEAQIIPAQGGWHAWVPEEPGSYSGAEAHGFTEDELLAKLTAPPEPPPPEPVLDAITGIEQYTADIRSGGRRVVWWDRALWWRTHREGGFDGYRTLAGRRLPCATMETAVRRPDLADEIRELSGG